MVYETLLKFLTEKKIDILSKIDIDGDGNLLFDGEAISNEGMQKSVYDKDEDGVVDAAKSIHNLTTSVTFLNELPNEIINIKDIIDKFKSTSQLEVFDKTNQLPTVSKDKTVYIILNDFTTNGICIYLGKDGGYINLFDSNIESGSGATNVINQVTKLNVIAPKNIDININETKDFRLPDINVLKFKPGLENIVNTVCDFNNADIGDFEENANILFDGTMHLKTEYNLPITKLENGIYSVHIENSDSNIVRIGIM